MNAHHNSKLSQTKTATIIKKIQQYHFNNSLTIFRQIIVNYNKFTIHELVLNLSIEIVKYNHIICINTCVYKQFKIRFVNIY